MPLKTLKQGNISVTYDTDSPPDLMVYRCPHLNCEEFYFNKDDLDNHKVYGHAQLPKSLITTPQQPVIGTKHFSKDKMSHMKKLNAMQTLKHYQLILHIWMEKDPTKLAQAKEAHAKLADKIAEAKERMANKQQNNGQKGPSLLDKLVGAAKTYVEKRRKPSVD